MTDRPVGFYVRLTKVEKELVAAAAKQRKLTTTELARRSVLFEAAAVYEFEGPEVDAFEDENDSTYPAWWPGIANQELFEGMHWVLFDFPPDELESISKRCWDETGKGDLKAFMRKLLLEKK